MSLSALGQRMFFTFYGRNIIIKHVNGQGTNMTDCLADRLSAQQEKNVVVLVRWETSAAKNSVLFLILIKQSAWTNCVSINKFSVKLSHHIRASLSRYWVLSQRNFRENAAERTSMIQQNESMSNHCQRSEREDGNKSESDEDGKTEEDRGETAGSGRERWTDREKERSH